MSPLDTSAPATAELPMLRPVGKLGDPTGKLTPRRLPPFEGGFPDGESPGRSGVTNAYPEEARSPAAPMNLTPRPPAEGPEGRSVRRRAQGVAPAPVPCEERKGTTSLPPVPLTAREPSRRDMGASGSSIASARGGSRGSRTPAVKGKPPMPKATPSPKDEASSRASSSQGRPSSGAAAALWDLERLDAELEPPSPSSPHFSAELAGRPAAPCGGPSSFAQVVEEMEREKELWHEKTLALLVAPSPNIATSTSTSSTAATVATAPTPVQDQDPTPTGPSDLPTDVPGDAAAGDDSPAEEEPPPGPSLIAQALRDAGLDPETALMDLAQEASAPAPRDWRSGSKSWAASLAKRKKERCSSGRGSPCSGRGTPER